MQDETQKTATTAADPALGRSSVAKLPADVREAVDRAIADGVTIDEITAGIRDAGESCSRSAVGRYAKDARALIQKQQEANRTVEAWMQKFGERPHGELAIVLIDRLRAMVLDAMEQLAKRKEPVSMEELAQLSLVMKRIESTDELRIRREQAMEKAAEAAKPKPRKGLSPETVALIDEAVLGEARWPVGSGTSGPVDPLNPAESHLSPDNPAERWLEIAPGV